MDAETYQRLSDVAHDLAEIPWEFRFQAIRELPTTTYWLARAIELLSDRDPVDALNDSEYLFKLMAMRCNQVLAENDMERNHSKFQADRILEPMVARIKERLDNE